MSVIISGIQQMGIGVPNVTEAFDWYRKFLGMDIKMFEEAATAGLMLPYTGGEPRDRHAILALNIQGGGGMEIWQYTSRVPQPADFEIQMGDLGTFCMKVKSQDVQKSYELLKRQSLNVISEVMGDPRGFQHFFLKDLYGNLIQVVQANNWFSNDKNLINGGVYGAMIGVSDMEKSIAFYSDILGYDKVVYDKNEIFGDLLTLPSGDEQVRRVLLQHSRGRKGPFSNLLGASEIELVQCVNRTPQQIFKDRFWGDLGYIHLCFDIVGMDEMRELCASKGYPFTVDSSSSAAHSDTFDMGEAAGHFSYIEDPDGTLIEFVETHKIPLIKKVGWYLNLRKRNPEKPLPNWMLKTLKFSRVKG